MAINWLNTEQPKRVSWLDDGSNPDFSNIKGGFTTGRTTDVSQNSEVPRLGFVPDNEDTQSAPVHEGLFSRALDSAARMAQPIVSGVTAPAIAGARTIPAQASSVVGGAQQAYAELTPDWMYPLSSPQEVRTIRQTVGDDGAQRYVESQQEIAAIKQEALDKGADPFTLDAAITAPTTAAMLGASVVNPALGLGVLAGVTAPQSYAGFREEGLSPSQAAMAAITDTAAEVVPSIVPATAIARSARLGSVPGAAAVATAEGAQEGTTDLLQQSNRVQLGLQEDVDVGQAIRSAGLGAALGAPAGAIAGRQPRSVRLGIPVADAAAQATANIQTQAGVDVPTPPLERSQSVSTTQATSVATEADTAPQAVTEAPTSIPRSERIRARFNNETQTWERELTATDFERVEEQIGMPVYTRRQQNAARRAGFDVDALLRGETPATTQPEVVEQTEAEPATPEETFVQGPDVLRGRVSQPLEAPVSVSESVSSPEATQVVGQDQTALQDVTQPPSAVQESAQPVRQPAAPYIRRAMALANEQGIEATPEWLQQQVREMQETDVSDMAVRSGTNPSQLSYYQTAEEIPQEFRNTNPPRENQLPVINAIKSATNAREAVDALRPLIQSESLKSFADKIGNYIDLSEIPVITVNPEDATRDIGAARYLVAKGKENTVGSYSPTNREIYLKGEGWKNNGMNAEAFLHELQHAASVHVYEAVKAGSIADESIVKAVNDLESIATEFNSNKDVFASFPQETRDRLRYATTNPKEFMAITQTSPLVQNALKKEGLWKRFVNAIRGMFGLSRSEVPLLERILKAGDDVMAAQQRAQLATAPPAAGTVVNEADYPARDLTFEDNVSQETPRQAQTKTRSFRNWFGDSKVVDANGEPLVVYHGTSRDFSAFDTGSQGAAFANDDGAFPRDGFWFTSDASNADFYSSMAARSGGSRQTVPVYLSIKNPFRISASQWVEEGESAVPTQLDLEGQGYDGMIIERAEPDNSPNPEADALWEKNQPVYGAPYAWPAEQQAAYYRLLERDPKVLHTHYVAFQPTQIKSATGNRGTFDPESDSILEMALQRQSTRERMREEENARSRQHYENTPTWVKNTKRVFSWIGTKDPTLARQQEALTLQKAALGVPEREIAKRGDKIQSIIRNEGLDSGQALADVDNILRGQPAPNVNPKIEKEAKRIRSLIDGAQTELLQALSPADPRATPEMVDQIYNSIGSYISRSYLRNFYKPGPVERMMSRGREGSAWTNMMKEQDPKLYKELVRFIDEQLVIPNNIDTLNETQVDLLADKYGITGRDKRAALAAERQKFGSPEAMRNYIIEGISAVSNDSPIKVVRQAARDEGILEHRENVPEVIRKWWGEITDPVTAAAITFDRLGTLAAETRMLNNIAEKGLGVYVFDENNPAPTGESLTRLNNAKLGPLNGKLVRTELKNFLDTQIGLTELKNSDDWKELAATLGNNLVVRPGGIAKGMATVFSLPTMAMNVQSNMILAANDALVMGALSKLNPGDKYQDYKPINLVKYSIQDAFRNVNNTEQVKKLVAAGVLRDGVSLGELRSTVRDLERKLRTEASPTRRGRLRGKGQQVFQGFSDFMADFYQLSDNLPRLIAFSSNLANLQRAFPDLNQKEIWDMAADRARDMTPTFGRASPAVVIPSKVLGNFGTWAGEVVRTYANRYKFAIQDMKRGTQDRNPRLFQYGAAQLAATTSSLTANAFAIPALMSLLGAAIADDETDEKIRNLAPDWLSDKNLIAQEIDKENKRIYVWNTTRNDPAAPIQEVANRIRNEGEALPEVLGYIRDTVLQPGMYLENAAQAATGYRRPTQSLLRGEPLREVEGSARVRPLVGSFLPGTVRQVERAVDQYQRGSDENTQLSRAIGVPVEEIDVPRVVADKTYAYRDAERNIDEGFRRDLSNPNPMTEEQFRSALSEYLVDSKNLFDDLQTSLNSAKDVVGMTNAELGTILKDASGATNRSERARLLGGEYRPRAFSRDWLSGVEERALRENVRDPAYIEQVKQEFAQRRQWLSTYTRGNKWQELLGDGDGG